MNDYNDNTIRSRAMVYQSVKLQVTPKQQKAALRGAKMRLTPSCIGSGQLVMLHPLNYKKVINAKGGINLELSPGEIMATAAHHGMVPKISGELSGEGIFDSIWSGLKSVGSWLKSSGVGSALADAAMPAVAGVLGPAGAVAARSVLKSTTGVGLKTKGPKGKGLYLSSKGSGAGSGLYL